MLLVIELFPYSRVESVRTVRTASLVSLSLANFLIPLNFSSKYLSFYKPLISNLLIPQQPSFRPAVRTLYPSREHVQGHKHGREWVWRAVGMDRSHGVWSVFGIGDGVAGVLRIRVLLLLFMLMAVSLGPVGVVKMLLMR